MEIDKKRFQKMFPSLSKEIGGEEGKIAITSIRTEAESGEKVVSKRFEAYNPDVIDFLRRCDNEEHAREIIEYLEREKEITSKDACNLIRQLREKGMRSFGTKKEEDYYLRKAGF
ncbi:MAG: DUF2095 domain-containing protein [Candidatus Bathyarchaeota archaeon]|nr:DUF2095 domain-containing protein [Candidatus Bathyarchaeota archaeon]